MDDNSFKYFNKFYNTLTDSFYSVMDLDFTVSSMVPAKLLTDEVLEARYTPIFLNSTYGSSGIKHIDGIFKHSNGFYIYLSREGSDLSVSFKIKIIYKSEQYEEIKLYINNLKKIK